MNGACFSWEREKELNDLMNVISTYDNRKRIIYLYGEHHVGKTVLCKKLVNQLRSETQFIDVNTRSIHHYNYATFDFREIQNLTEFETIDKIYSYMSEHWDGIEFPRYEMARLFLSQRYNSTSECYDLPKSDWKDTFEIILSCLKDSSMAMLSNDPQISLNSILVTSFLLSMSIPFFSKKLNKAKDFILRKFKNITLAEMRNDINAVLQDKSDQDIKKKLTEYFLLDLETFCKHSSNTNILILDTFERCSKRNLTKQWFYSKLIEPSRYLLWIIFGAEKNAFENVSAYVNRSMIDSPWEDNTDSHWEDSIQKPIWIMKRFSDEISMEWLNFSLKTAGIKSSINTLRHIAKLSQGLPGALGLLYDAYIKISKIRTPLIEDFDMQYEDKEFYPELLSIYLQNADKYEKDVLEFLSVFDIWNYDLCMYYLNINNISLPEQFFQKLIQLSIIQEFSDNSYIILDLPRAALSRNIPQEDYYSYTKIGYQFYKQKCDELLEQWLISNDWNYELYQTMKSAALKAVYYGSESCSDKEQFEEFSHWFVKSSSGAEGFEQRLSKAQLYELKGNLLKKYLEKAEDKEYFSANESMYQLQAYYDLAWSSIYTHDHITAVNSIVHRMGMALLNYKSDDEETIKCIYSLGVIFQRWGRYDDSEFWHSIALQQRELNGNQDIIALSLNTLADAKMNNTNNCMRFQNALPLFERSLEIKKDLLSYESIPQKRMELWESIITTKGNISKLYFLWGEEEECIDKIQYAIKEVDECIAMKKRIKASKREFLTYEVRILTAKFEIDRLSHNINRNKAQYYLTAFKKYKETWEKDAQEKRDFIHWMLNTQNNLAVAYAYARDIDTAIALLNTCAYERSRQMTCNFQYEKNAQISKFNLETLNKSRLEGPDKLVLIY